MYTALVLGFVVLTVLLTSLFKQIEWSTRAKSILSIVISTIGGTLTFVLTKGNWDNLLTADLFQTVITVYGGSQVFYNLILKGTLPEQKLAEIGSKNNEV